MKKLSSILLLGLVVLASACHKDDDSNDPAPTSGADIRGVITTDQHWTKDKVYRLRGYVYVANNATLTIDAGTKIISNNDSAGVLVIYKGSKIMAEGTAQSPIVFTSGEATPKSGDFGGLVLVGESSGNGNHKILEGGVDQAYQNFGGTKEDDNSGVLKYVRIEYAGKAVNPGDEVNGLSLYAVGSGTTIDYVEVVRGLDDAFEFFGGSVNPKHLIAYNCADDDFDLDDGYHGKIQFAVSIKNPGFTDTKTGGDLSNNFEVDNTNGKISYATTPITSPVLSNFTAIGPNNAAGTSVDYGYGMRWRRGCKFILANSIVMGGQKAGLVLEIAETGAFYKSGVSKFYNSFLHSVTSPFLVSSEVVSTIDSATVANITTTTNLSKVFTDAATIKLTDPFNNAAPNLKPQAGSPALTTAAKFDLTELSSFEKVSYIGAFDGTNDWTAGWAVWNK
ncbi:MULTISPECIES: hypothetical protein [Niastella]|uniref:T9SS C-terminal target domain-containing protein n=1 Tax=Niastella soli TaxID=2821487 RepID=A0ABS3YQY8_9BACT|nr:hypothetical protein [Niastella soli]MBO9200295.1 hypothetical protein [Niastella soli]